MNIIEAAEEIKKGNEIKWCDPIIKAEWKVKLTFGDNATISCEDWVIDHKLLYDFKIKETNISGTEALQKCLNGERIAQGIRSHKASLLVVYKKTNSFYIDAMDYNGICRNIGEFYWRPSDLNDKTWFVLNSDYFKNNNESLNIFEAISAIKNGKNVYWGDDKVSLTPTLDVCGTRYLKIGNTHLHMDYLYNFELDKSKYINGSEALQKCLDGEKVARKEKNDKGTGLIRVVSLRGKMFYSFFIFPKTNSTTNVGEFAWTLQDLKDETWYIDNSLI